MSNKGIYFGKSGDDCEEKYFTSLIGFGLRVVAMRRPAPACSY